MININQFTEQLRMMPDQALQRVAMMYKQDPYIFPMVISEGMARKKLRASAQMQGPQGPQPKVVDQALMAMAEPPPQPQGAPGAGIAGLPTPNIQHMADGGIAGYDEPGQLNYSQQFAQHSEPVVRMAEGGVARFDEGGVAKAKNRFIEQYRDLAEQVGADTGVDPAMILSQWGLESGWGTKTVGQFNFGNIKDVTGKGPRAEDKAEGSRDAYKSYSSPEEFAGDYANLLRRNFPKALGTGSDIGKFTEGLSKGTKGTYATDPAYAMKLGRVYGDLKETLTPPVPSDAGSTAAPVTANTAGAGIAGLMGGMGAKELLGATFKPGTTARQAAGRIITGAAVVPAAVLDGGAAASKKAADVLAAASPEQRAQFYENPMIGAMGGDTALAAAIMNAGQGQPIKPPTQSTPYKQQMEKAVKTAISAPGKAIAAVPGAIVDTVAGKPKEYGPSLGHDWAESVPMSAKKEIIQETKANAEPEIKAQAKKEGWTNDDWLTLGFNLLANRSQNFSEALGTAGLGVLAAQKERAKTAREEAKEKSEAEYRKALGEQARRGPAEIALIERVAKEKNIPFSQALEYVAGAKREPMTEESWLKAWSNSPMLQAQFPNAQDYVKLMRSAQAAGTQQFSTADQALVNKYLKPG